MNWHVGQKIVCIDSDIKHHVFKDYHQLTKDVIYTIRNIIDYPDGDLGFHLFEITNPRANWKEGFCEMTYNQKRFRPIQDSKTDISIFTNMLKENSFVD